MIEYLVDKGNTVDWQGVLQLLQLEGRNWHSESIGQTFFLRGVGVPDTYFQLLNEQIIDANCKCKAFSAGSYCVHLGALLLLCQANLDQLPRHTYSYRRLKTELSQGQLLRFVDAMCKQDPYLAKRFALQFLHLKREGALFLSYKYLIEKSLGHLGKKKVLKADKKVIEFVSDCLNLQEDLWSQAHFYSAVDLAMALVISISEIIDFNNEVYMNIYNRLHNSTITQFNALQSPPAKEKIYNAIWTTMLLYDYKHLGSEKDLFVQLALWRKFGSRRSVHLLTEKLKLLPSVNSVKVHTYINISLHDIKSLSLLIRDHLHEAWYNYFLLKIDWNGLPKTEILLSNISSQRYAPAFDPIVLYLAEELSAFKQCKMLLDKIYAYPIFLSVAECWKSKLPSGTFIALLSILLEKEISVSTKLWLYFSIGRIEEAIQFIGGLDILIGNLKLIQQNIPNRIELVLDEHLQKYLNQHYGKQAKDKIKLLLRKLDEYDLIDLKEKVYSTVRSKYADRLSLNEIKGYL